MAYYPLKVKDSSGNTHVVGDPRTAAKAEANDAALTGTPTAPTASSGTNTTQIATTAFVQTAIGNVIDGAPGALDTLNELAAALGDDANYASTITNALALKAPLASPTFTGTVTTPLSSGIVKSSAGGVLSAASTIDQSEVSNLGSDLALKAPLASPDLTGTPTAPTAAADTNTTQLATTAYVIGQLASVSPSALGTAAVGSSTRFARADHVHAAPTVASLGAVAATGGVLTSPVFIAAEERMNIVAAAATGTINFDILTASVWYYTTAASADFTLNLRGNSGSTLNSILAVGDSLTAVFLNTNGATARRPTVFQIDGSSVTPLWQGGTAPTSGNASSTDAYTLTVIKTAAAPTYVVLASQTQYK